MLLYIESYFYEGVLKISKSNSRIDARYLAGYLPHECLTSPGYRPHNYGYPTIIGSATSLWPGLSIGRLVGLSFFSLKGGKLHFHTSSGELIWISATPVKICRPSGLRVDNWRTSSEYPADIRILDLPLSPALIVYLHFSCFPTSHPTMDLVYPTLFPIEIPEPKTERGIHIPRYRVFMKNLVFSLKLWFFWTLSVLLQRWFSTCLVCVHTLTPREYRVRNIFKNWEKTRYFMNTLYIRRSINILLILTLKGTEHIKNENWCFLAPAQKVNATNLSFIRSNF